ncbi:hypothetical protein LXM50_13380 [Microbacterium sp. Au-Mic1]|uniref:hypothetical protein n=1 Tax=Microbacterium sp. Au-Mic1 TaxID=2906457 RepID=UPI001E472C12|nr:hypothetical protein [Microbacterium sp. Au-Mic1]MCE4026965.1 hypothetical protein [Microbacterium sp. Au-Mic1]
MDFNSLDLIGAPFELVETYVYYDGPRTFAMRSTGMPDLYYVVNTVDEDEETGDVVALVAAVSSDRFRAMRSGVVPFRAVFTEAAHGSLFRVDWAWEYEPTGGAGWVPTISSLIGGDLPNRWLPSEEARLSLLTATVEPYEPSRLVALSQAQARTLFAIEVEHEGARITEFPARNAGELQVAVDGAIVSIAKEFVGTRRTPITRELHVSTLELQAASFVLVMAIDSGGVVEPTDVTSEVFDQLSSFIDAVASNEVSPLLEELKKHSPKTRNRLRDMLKPLAAVGSGITLSTAIAHTNALRAVSAEPVSVRAAVEFIETVPPEVSYVDVRRGVLTGLVLRTQRFEIVDAASNTPYKGSMSDEATDEANGLIVGNESYVTAKIRVETPLTNDDEQTAGVKYFLESIERFAENSRQDDEPAP